MEKDREKNRIQQAEQKIKAGAEKNRTNHEEQDGELPGVGTGVGTGVGCGVGTGVGFGVGNGVGTGVGTNHRDSRQTKKTQSSPYAHTKQEIDTTVRTGSNKETKAKAATVQGDRSPPAG